MGGRRMETRGGRGGCGRFWLLEEFVSDSQLAEMNEKKCECGIRKSTGCNVVEE